MREIGGGGQGGQVVASAIKVAVGTARRRLRQVLLRQSVTHAKRDLFESGVKKFDKDQFNPLCVSRHGIQPQYPEGDMGMERPERTPDLQSIRPEICDYEETIDNIEAILAREEAAHLKLHPEDNKDDVEVDMEDAWLADEGTRGSLGAAKRSNKVRDEASRYTRTEHEHCIRNSRLVVIVPRGSVQEKSHQIRRKTEKCETEAVLLDASGTLLDSRALSGFHLPRPRDEGNITAANAKRLLSHAELQDFIVSGQASMVVVARGPGFGSKQTYRGVFDLVTQINERENAQMLAPFIRKVGLCVAGDEMASLLYDLKDSAAAADHAMCQRNLSSSTPTDCLETRSTAADGLMFASAATRYGTWVGREYQDVMAVAAYLARGCPAPITATEGKQTMAASIPAGLRVMASLSVNPVQQILGRAQSALCMRDSLLYAVARRGVTVNEALCNPWRLRLFACLPNLGPEAAIAVVTRLLSDDALTEGYATRRHLFEVVSREMAESTFRRCHRSMKLTSFGLHRRRVGSVDPRMACPISYGPHISYRMRCIYTLNVNHSMSLKSQGGKGLNLSKEIQTFYVTIQSGHVHYNAEGALNEARLEIRTVNPIRGAAKKRKKAKSVAAQKRRQNAEARKQREREERSDA
ncbi:hypothetical protein KIPB_005839, partial [Kipferlia bialata]|eukprot:g5839.t1